MSMFIAAFGLGLGLLGAQRKGAASGPPPAGSFILLTDGSSYLLLTDGSSKLQRA